jgi:hypothetical protein
MVRRLEALADAICHYSGWDDPESEGYQARNPMLLKAFLPKHPRNLTGKRVFRSLLDGYQAGLFDLATKCVGKSHSGLKPESSLRELMYAYGFPEAMARSVAKFLRRALQDESINEATQLSIFVSE